MKTLVAAFLMITLSGAYCLFCCQEILAAAGQPAHHQAGRTAQAEHCDFSKSKTSGTLQAFTKLSAFECCGLKFGFFAAKLEKKGFPQKALVPANNFSVFPGPVKFENKTRLAGFKYRAPVRASRDLHVKNRVFRI